MLAEREIDDRMRRFSLNDDIMQRFSLNATPVPRKGYDHGTKEWAVRLLIETEEEEEQNNEDEELKGVDDTDERNSDDEEVDVTDDENSLDRIEKVDYVFKVLQRDMQDVRDFLEQDMKEIAVMNRMLSLLTSMYAEKKEMHEELSCTFFRRRDRNTTVVRTNDGKRYHIIIPTHKKLAEM